MNEPIIFNSPLINERLLNKNIYIERILEDDNLLDKDLLVKTGNKIFNTDKVVVNPLKDGKIDLFNSFWSFKVINGVRSLRRGFYKICTVPQNNSAGIPIWKADVLFNSGKANDETYKYTANVGPLVNRYSVRGNLSTNKITTQKESIYKQSVLESLYDRTIYVSRAEFVSDEQYGLMKEVLWFTWH